MTDSGRVAKKILYEDSAEVQPITLLYCFLVSTNAPQWGGGGGGGER